MTQPLTFGVELEFALAYLKHDTPLPHPEDTRKVLQFHPTEEDWARNDGTLTPEDLVKTAMKYAARRHLRKTIREAGFPVSDEKLSKAEADVSKWEVVDDDTIKTPKGSPYSWFSMEVRSPALFFTSCSLKSVADVVSLLVANFGIHINVSMGLHVHCGDSDRSFDLVTLSKLVSFCWAFETQLNSLHPAARQDQPWAASMRESSVYALQYEAKYGRRPNPLTGVIHFLNSKSIREAVRHASGIDQGDKRTYKFNQYNFSGIHHRAKGVKDSKATIEFRQHEGSMSAIAIVQWIKTAVGIVDHIQHIDNGSLTDLLRIVERETWEKLGDGKDAAREAKHGPILAESGFTVIHLLRHMHLFGLATYYNSRWKKLDKKARMVPTSQIEWEYENTAIPGSDEYKRLDRLREIWEENRIVSAAQPPGRWKFDPNHPAWPKHRYLSEDWDAATHPSDPSPEVSTQGSTDDGSDDSSDDKGAASIPNQPTIPKPPEVPNSDPNTLDDLPNTAEELDALNAKLDKELEELEAPYSADNLGVRDTVWRERVRDGDGKDNPGIGVIPKGSMNSFDDSQPIIRGTFPPDSPDVSPKTVPSQADEGNDGEMPFPLK